MFLGYDVDCERFNEYAISTARMMVDLYPWYYMPVTVHKILIHGAEVISSFLIPIGQLSEEALEARNKDIKRFRTDHTRKTSRTATNTDLLHRLLETSDPLISSKRENPKQIKEPLTEDTLKLLIITDVQGDASDSE